jgi:crotonobetainyl-CoA:carnitine CoA-transferase CaiB-like acyl-CoA transferase
MMRAMADTPLTGIRVLDITTSSAGPYSRQVISALDADVVKVERPDTGDDGRAWGLRSTSARPMTSPLSRPKE